ncbi:hypothetical protein PTE30175_04074 [Pandoraea terrae]|uniref:Twitching motility protein PilT n=1 Tax=Pandoraea terrae TaxID=1537710 RepID=A0A5E4XY81_9BURK|nr:Mut7-C RNAse domain-containing protein [Pandoraea terrae]VVE41300.1 hypothetical protein PTE30175_04074 [Pandoraea terrae]
MVTATFRFYEELNDFLPRERRRREFDCPCARAATTKHMIEALGVPHTEVELVLVDGESVGFDHLIANGERVAVYPKFEALDITSLLRVREHPLRHVRFVADAHLGGLAHLLRMAGFDTLYDNNFDDREIAAISARDERIVLTRDRDLLKRRNITHGCYVRALKPRQQLHEIFGRLDLAGSIRPFSLCLDCNAPLHALAADVARSRAPPSVRARFTRYATCDICQRVFWEGSHWRRMRDLLDEVVGTATATPASE